MNASQQRYDHDRMRINNVFLLYKDGFRQMTLGRTLWKVILIKVLIIFGVIKFFFFPDFLQTKFSNDNERAAYVMENITNLPNPVQKAEGISAFTVDDDLGATK
jgi:hypothetical protein